MTDATEKQDPLIQKLRLFRFQKLKLNCSENGMSSSSQQHAETQSVSPVKMFQTDVEKSTNPVGLKGLIQAFPMFAPEKLEKCFVKAKGDLSLAKRYVREDLQGWPKVKENANPHGNDVVKQRSSNQEDVKSPLAQTKNTNTIPKTIENGTSKEFTSLQPPPASNLKRVLTPDKDNEPTLPKKRFKRIKRESSSSDYSGDEDGGYKKNDLPVYDSDEDSDAEISDVMTTDQTKVYDFLAEASLVELLCVPQTSRKKADGIIELRPFTGWRDMVSKFEKNRSLGAEILNNAQDYLYIRQVVTQLMNKCNKLSSELELANLNGTCHYQQPSILSSDVVLAPHQVIGLNWLIMLHKRGLNGILADEMGLGKTIQVISFLAWLKETSSENPLPHLIVVPASTLDNWKNELNKWCPAMKVTVYYGAAIERRSMRAGFSRDGIDDIDVILTTYNLVSVTPEERKMFRVLRFKYVVFDEAHMLKNMNTIRYEYLYQVNAKNRILVTGTPLQNNLLELMSLLTFVMPEMFANKKDCLKSLFTRKAGGPKEKADNNCEEIDVSALPQFEQEKIAQAKKIMKPFVLRRLKKDVLTDLPLKTIVDYPCTMTERQRLVYDKLVTGYRSSEAVEEECKGMHLMMQLRKVSCHPLLKREIYDDDYLPKLVQLLVAEPSYPNKEAPYVLEDLSILSDFEIHSLCRAYKSLNSHCLSSEQIEDSGKIAAFNKLLPQLMNDGHRVLIFSQFVMVLDILVQYLDLKGYKYLRLDGSTPVTVRQELINEFNEDPSIFIFLLTTRAGGLGINLTAADTVIMHDMDFNPYNDKQAEDRCHRVGQTKNVTVYRFLVTNSIEEDMKQIAQAKLILEKEISNEDKLDSKKVLQRLLGVNNLTVRDEST